MTFLDDTPELRSSKFGGEDLAWARSYLVNSVRFLDADWLDQPVGPIGERWLSNGDGSATYLINLAYTLRDLDQVTNKSSLPTFHDKLRAILRPANNKSFEEDLTEIEFGSHLGAMASPVFFEPLATDDPSNKQRSPDYAVALPSGITYFEVTCPTFEFVTSWETGAAEAAKAMEGRLWQKGLRRVIRFRASITASREDLSGVHSKDVLDTIEANPHGSIELTFVAGKAEVWWQPIAEHAEDAGPEDFTAPFSILSASVMSEPAVDMAYEAIIDEDLEERVISSLRNSLKRKRDQLVNVAPCLIVIRVTQLHEDAVIQSIFRRILANPVYSWITGIVWFVPMRSWTKDSRAAQISLLANTCARVPVSSDLRDMLTRQKVFRLERVTPPSQP